MTIILSKQAVTIAIINGVPTILVPLAREIKQLVATSIPTPVATALNKPSFLFITNHS